ncbi:hypothetical protein RhiJN_14949 [Ceratobasidium sp. AG-Ba]|nr:hypothetical protein RhiJN_00609 [Ceratobasidium sp. AG-Ba]QRV86931.1 hypothetical protein RhiJN_14949 [Ceratobasidium sp. AG-Ba]QRW15488.1 hypothetical protein RhiLY_14487 [Ceratobasidium sp. AG-Ba]
MPSNRFIALRERIASDPNALETDPNLSSEETTANGTKRGDALYDTPSPGKEISSLIVEGPRSRRPSRDAAWHNENREASKARSETRKYNDRLRAERASQPIESTAELTDASRTSKPRSSSKSKRGGRRSSSRGRRRAPASTRKSSPALKIATRGSAADAGPSSSTRGRGRGRGRVNVQDVPQAEQAERRRMQQDLRNLPRSPTPGSTDGDIEDEGELEIRAEASQAQPSTQSQYTYVLETPSHSTLAEYAAAHIGGCYDDWSYEDIAEALKVAAEDQAHKVRAPEPKTKIVMLETTGARVGGGWLNEANAKLATVLGKRASGEGSAGSSAKRVRTSNPNDTATESESDKEPAVMVNSNGSPPPPPPPPPLRAELPHRPLATLERESTATTVLDAPLEGQPPQTSPSLSDEPSRFPSLPNLLSNILPPRGPVHARLKRKVVEREYARDLEMARQEAPPAPTTQDPDVEMSDLREDDQTSAPPPSPVEPSPPPHPVPPPSLVKPTAPAESQSSEPAAPRVQRTYAGDRTHAGPGNDGPAPDGEEAPRDARKSRQTRSVLDYLHESMYLDNSRPTRKSIKAARIEARARARLLSQRAEPSSLPSRSFNGPTPSYSQSTSRPQQPSRRTGPVAAADADLAAFNERCARDNAPSFVESVTRQTSRQARIELLEPRVRTELLADEEEDIAHAEAVKEGKQPNRGRKKKPLARDVHGIRRQILQYAKIHLFAYALVEGVYQTRGTYLLWAAYVHEATWHALLPDTPYRAATQDELEVMVNYIATLRGKVKEKVRMIVEIVYEFDGRIVTQQDIEANLDRFNEIHPNTFHCTSFRPRRGHFESEHIARCIAAALFQGPNSVGVLFPDYFEEMPLTVVAFILAMMQFCIEEWQQGYFVAHDLGASKMLDKYETHLAGLKELRSVAPRRMEKLQKGWSEYAFDYCGASFLDKDKDRDEAVFHSEFRPDTPPPEAPSESSRRTSLRALGPENSRDFPEDGEDQLYSPVHGSPIERTRSPNPFLNYSHAKPPGLDSSRPPLPDAEYNEYGYRTAHSKGKGRAD